MKTEDLQALLTAMFKSGAGVSDCHELRRLNCAPSEIERMRSGAAPVIT